MHRQYTLPFLPFTQIELTCEWCSSTFLVSRRYGHRRYCSFAHYTVARRDQSERTLQARAWAKVDRNGPLPDRRPELGPCWLWTAARNGHGYGHLGLNGDVVAAHRVTWESVNGPIPDGLELDHLCRNRACVRPDHLEPVTSAENLRRGDQPSSIVARTGMPRCGHPLTPENTMMEGAKRRCRQCRRDGWRRRYVAHPRPALRGEEQPSARLTEADVREIRDLYAQGVGPTALGKTYGVTKENIRAIVKRRTWKHLL
jgi:hypothetical protein